MPGALNDALNNAYNGFVRNFIDIGRGTNPLSQPQISELIGFNIPGIPLVSTRDYFLLQLQSWLTSIPLQTQWIAVIDTFPLCLRTDLIQALERTDGGRKGFDIDQAKTLLTQYPFQKVIGCVFAQGATIPRETYRASSIAVENNRGFVPGIIAGEREGFAENQLTLNFLETNTSIIDFVFRPWVIMASHYGYVARPGDLPGSRDFFNIKSNLTLLCYTRSYQNISQIPRKVFTFYNIVPTLINPQTLDYTEEPSQAISYAVNFTYTNYTVQNSLYFPLADVITNISGIVNGNYTPQISPLQNSRSYNPAAFF